MTEVIGPDERPADVTARVISTLIARGLTIAVAESLTGGLLTAELIRIPGASEAVLGGAVAYATELKHTLLGVDAGLLAEQGPVHPDVAIQMAIGVRHVFAVAGKDADIGLATTGVAGPDASDGKPPGTVFLGFAVGEHSHATALQLTGDRTEIRAQAVRLAITELDGLLRHAL